MFPRLSGRSAVALAFALDGAVYGSWAARVPALGEHAGAGPAGLGLALLGPGAAMVLTASPAGRLCARWGPRGTVTTALVLALLVLPLAGAARTVWQLGLGLAVLGGLMGAVDVGVNVAAVAVTRELGRPLMPWFHAGFSVGGLAGAGGAALAAALSASPARQFAVVGVVGAAVVALCGRSLPSGGVPEGPGGGTAPVRRMVTDPRLWLLAGVALCAAVAEGACSEWSGLFLVKARGTGAAVGTAGYAVFTLAVALTRLTGEPVQRRLGPHRTLAAGGALAAAGLLLAVAVPSGAAGFAGFALAGAGLASCFPVALGLAGGAAQGGSGDGGGPGDGGNGGRELGFVTTVAYAGLLGGPPLIGAVAGAAGMGAALAAVAVVAAAVAPAAAAVARLTGPAGRAATAGSGAAGTGGTSAEAGGDVVRM